MYIAHCIILKTLIVQLCLLWKGKYLCLATSCQIDINTFAPIYDHCHIALFCPSCHTQLWSDKEISEMMWFPSSLWNV